MLRIEVVRETPQGDVTDVYTGWRAVLYLPIYLGIALKWKAQELLYRLKARRGK